MWRHNFVISFLHKTPICLIFLKLHRRKESRFNIP